MRFIYCEEDNHWMVLIQLAKGNSQHKSKPIKSRIEILSKQPRFQSKRFWKRKVLYHIDLARSDVVDEDEDEIDKEPHKRLLTVDS